jgi:DNA-binding NarL/FixJ family response regulator
MDIISIILADDHPIIRRGLRSLLEKQPDMMVVGEASNGEEALRLVGD